MPKATTAPVSRRRFLALAGAAAIGTVTFGIALETVGQPNATDGGAGGTDPLSGSGAGGSPGSATKVPADSPGPGSAARHRYHSRPDLTPPVVGVVTPNGPPSPGLTFLTPNNGAGSDGPLIVDNAGHPIWVRPDKGGVGASTFRPITYRGQPALSWWEGANNNGIGIGEFVIADPAYHELTRVKAVGSAQADHHEFLVTATDRAFLFSDTGAAANAVVGTSSPEPWKVLDCAIQEIDLATGALLFEWHAIDHIGLDETFIDPPSSADTLHDYVHANSIEIDTDGNLIMSARNTSTIYKIDRTTGTVIWRLGGKASDFTLGPGAAFSWQHDARRQADGSLSLFDDSVAPGTSRGLILELDETAMTASLVREYRHAPPIQSSSEGNLQVLPNGHVLVGWGSVSAYTEFTAGGEVVMDATFPASATAYRDLRYPWVGKPADQPALAVVPESTGMTVYASWNGATEIAHWQVLAGDSPGSLAQVASGPWTGFESTIAVASLAAVVAVRAVDRSGRVLGTSASVGGPG
jgi:hypothetical protein